MMQKACLAIAALLLCATAPASAQLIAAQDSKEPIDITGDTAEFQDNNAVSVGLKVRVALN